MSGLPASFTPEFQNAAIATCVVMCIYSAGLIAYVLKYLRRKNGNDGNNLLVSIYVVCILSTIWNTVNKFIPAANRTSTGYLVSTVLAGYFNATEGEMLNEFIIRRLKAIIIILPKLKYVIVFFRIFLPILIYGTTTYSFALTLNLTINKVLPSAAQVLALTVLRLLTFIVLIGSTTAFNLLVLLTLVRLYRDKMTPRMKYVAGLYCLSFLLLSIFTIGSIIATILTPGTLSAAILGTVVFHTEPTHGIILALVVRQLVESAKAGTMDIGQVTQLSKRKATTRDKDNIYSIVNPETVVVNSNVVNSNVVNSNAMDSIIEN